MYRGHTIAAIVPAYNEAAYVGQVIDDLPDYVDRVYAVDDCSTDGTWDEIRSRASDLRERELSPAETRTAPVATVADGGIAAGTDVVAIRHESNQGAGGALKSGYRHAGRDGMDVTVTIDADRQMDPERMDGLLDPIVEGRAGYAKGNRLVDNEFQADMPRFRLLGNWLLTLLTRPASGYWRLRDPQNGYTAISHGALESVDIDALPDDHDYPNDLLPRLNLAGVTVADVPMPAVYGSEESTIDFTSFVPRTSMTLLQAFTRRLVRVGHRGRVHLPLLYLIGGLSFLLGLVTGTGWILSRIAGGTGRTSSGLLLVTAGMVATLLAVAGDHFDGDADVIRE